MAVNFKKNQMGKQMTILIVDDNHLMRETLRLIVASIQNLKLIGEARNGEEAIKMACEQSPDIVLMDINMSPINGFEATRKILEENPTIKIIGLSMHKKPAYVQKMLQLGAKGYLSKSDTHNEIIEVIKKVAAGEKYIPKNIDRKP